MRVIAIDGPAGSGKSTLARALASRLGLPHLDTGAMYRSVAWAALRRGIDPGQPEAVAVLARELDIAVADRVVVDGEDVTVAIRDAEVTTAVSAVAANPAVRRELVRRQQEWARARGGGVVEGRDIGTVVFPDADLKVYLDADPSVRARRRAAERPGTAEETLTSDLRERDERDAPQTRAAPDAERIDTTDLTIDEVIDRIASLVEARARA